MHTAYRSSFLVNLPLNIECLTSYHDSKLAQDFLLVGTNQGHLLMYTVLTNGADATVANAEPQHNDNQEPRVQLHRTNKHFSKKAIVSMHAVPEYSILVALTDSIISVHDLDLAVTNFPRISIIERTKGATAFALDLVRTKSLTGENAVTIKLAVAVRRKLQFYYWKNRKFHELYIDFTVSDIPRSIAWTGNTVCIGLRGEYNLIQLDENKVRPCDLVTSGKSLDTHVILMTDERFAMKKDNETSFIDLQGNCLLNSVFWSDNPMALVHDKPFLLAVMSKSVEIRADNLKLPIQTIPLRNPKNINSCRPGLVYVASPNTVWCLQMVSVSVQIPQLVRDKQFELAVTLSNIGEESLESKAKRVLQIQTLNAFDLFCNHKFKEAFDEFYKLNIDTSHVIGLFTDLLPQVFRSQLKYPDKLPILKGNDLHLAMESLLGYLTQIRHKLNGLEDKVINPVSIMDGCETITSKKRLLEILDTTLLKCYLQINPGLVAPLLRLKDNKCHLDETERLLKKGKKVSELVVFYNTKGEHRKALSLLKQNYEDNGKPLGGHMESVNYLQDLGSSNVDLICEFAEWILEVNDTDGLSIFTEDVMEVESLPRERVLEFLFQCKPRLLIPYLKHIIFTWNESAQKFHNTLILQYKDEILDLIKNQKVDEVNALRNDFKNFLLTSSKYNAEMILPQFPKDELHLERAILLGSLGRHKKALKLFLFDIHEFDGALRYCGQHYKPGSDVYTMLLEVLLEDKRKENVDKAVELLNNHGDKVDMKIAVALLPDSVPIQVIHEFLIGGLEKRVFARHHLALKRHLLHAEHLQVQEERIALESQSFTIGEFDVCRVCFKRFNRQGAIVRLVTGDKIHLSCQENPFKV